jgi:hypothetical protein
MNASSCNCLRKQIGRDGGSCAVRHPTVTIPAPGGIDWKALGYLVSILGVFLLGAVAWPKPSEPKWHLVVLIAGMATSILGMGFRYVAHLKQQKELRRAEAEARQARSVPASSRRA